MYTNFVVRCQSDRINRSRHIRKLRELRAFPDRNSNGTPQYFTALNGKNVHTFKYRKKWDKKAVYAAKTTRITHIEVIYHQVESCELIKGACLPCIIQQMWTHTHICAKIVIFNNHKLFFFINWYHIEKILYFSHTNIFNFLA